MSSDDQRPPLQNIENLLPEFRRCTNGASAFSFSHEKFAISHYSSSLCSCRRSATSSKGLRARSRDRDCEFAEWISLPSLLALGKTRRALDSFSLRGGPARSSVFGDRPDLCSCRIMRALCRDA